MKRALPSIALIVCVTVSCTSWLDEHSDSLNALEDMQLADRLEPSESYYLGRVASAVIVDEIPMSDLKDESVQNTLAYMNRLGAYVERRSEGLPRSGTSLGGFVERTAEQGQATQELTLFKGVRIGLLESDHVVAYATDGGFIWLSTGALELCTSEDELAALIAVHLAHVTLNHPMQCYREDNPNRIPEPVGKRAEWVYGEGLGAIFGRLAITYAESIMHDYYDTPYNLEADRFALLALLEAGHEPRALVSLLTSIARARFQPDAGDWLERQSDLDRRVAMAAKFVAENEMQVAPSWQERAEFRQKRFETALGR